MGIVYPMPFSMKDSPRFQRISASQTDHTTSDILTVSLRRASLDWFDVDGWDRFFGDILFPISAQPSSIKWGSHPSANLNRSWSSLLCSGPFHGSAPDIAREKTRTPVAQIWVGAMSVGSLARREPLPASRKPSVKLLARPGSSVSHS